MRQGAAATRLLRLFLDHRRPQALLLRGGGRGGRQKGVLGGVSHIHPVFE